MSLKPSSPSVLLIGACSSEQFSRVLTDNGRSSILNSERNRSVRSIPEAISLLTSGDVAPDLVVCYQSIPDEYIPSDIERLIGMLPLCRFIVVFSPWCESIGRTEQYWPTAWSVPLTHAPARIQWESQRFLAGEPPVPATASRDEAFASLAATCLKDSDGIANDITVRIESDDVALRKCFEGIVTSLGFRMTEAADPDVIIITAAFVDRETVQRVNDLQNQSVRTQSSSTNRSPLKIIVASDMTTPAQQLALREAGATVVISQLRFTEDLVDHLRWANRTQNVS